MWCELNEDLSVKKADSFHILKSTRLFKWMYFVETDKLAECARC